MVTTVKCLDSRLTPFQTAYSFMTWYSCITAGIDIFQKQDMKQFALAPLGGRLVLLFRASSTRSTRPMCSWIFLSTCAKTLKPSPAGENRNTDWWEGKNRLNFLQHVFWRSNRYGLVLWDSMIAALAFQSWSGSGGSDCRKRHIFT